MSVPESLFGGPLSGDSLVRIIYVDEAGISAHEPVTVVVGVIVHGDTQLLPAMHAIREAHLRWVPAQLRETFLFHAKDLVSKKYRDVWSFENRLGLLREMMAIPRTLNLPLALGLAVKEKFPASTPEFAMKLTLDEFAHAMAFACSMAMVGKFLREYGGNREVGMVVAEDSPDMRNALKRALIFLKSEERMITPIKISQTFGRVESDKVQFSAREVIDTVNFAAKSEALCLWLADACAFGLRRFYSQLQYGDDYAKLIIGDLPDLAANQNLLTETDTAAALFHGSRPAGINIRYTLSSP